MRENYKLTIIIVLFLILFIIVAPYVLDFFNQSNTVDNLYQSNTDKAMINITDSEGGYYIKGFIEVNPTIRDSNPSVAVLIYSRDGYGLNKFVM